MAELAESKMNFAALNKVDPYAKSLLETAAHVALYTFIDNEWEKTDIEGALFVYNRTGEPFHNILIMNRLNMKNLVEPVTQGLDLQLQDPFLLYRNPQGLIYGIWFYDKEECVKIATILTKIIKESGEVKSEKKNRHTVGSGGTNVDIFSMLTKAQEEYNSKSPRRMHAGLEGTGPHDLNYNFKELDPTPQSVMDFFAKASNGTKFISDPAVNIQPASMFLNNPRPGPPPGLSRLQSVPIAIPPPQSDVRPLLQRLMSNPAHSVEHIEKQQQAITPQSDFVGMIKNGSAKTSNDNGTTGNPVGQFESMRFKRNENGTVGNTVGQFESTLGFLRISDSPPSTVQTQQFFNSKLTQNQSPLMVDGSLETNMNHVENHRPLSAPMDTHSKPALMPPVMFTSSAKKEESPETLSTTPTIAVSTASGNTSFALRPEPLTKNQLLQAVNYLLKYDPDFINKLHEAYVKSFTELVQ